MEQPSNEIHVGDVVLYCDSKEVFANDTAHALTPLEFALLKTLMEKPGTVFTRAELMKLVWDTDYTEDTQVVTLYIHYIRNKIEAHPHKPIYIVRVKYGYFFSKPS